MSRGRLGPGVGGGPPGYHSDGWLVVLCCFCFFMCALAYWMVWLDRFWLQILWASLTLRHEYGEPPRETGMISSTSGLMGCGVWSVLSTGLPHIQQVS